MADDYQALGLNSKLQSINSPIANFQYTSGYDFDHLYEVQTNKANVGVTSSQQVIFPTFVKISDGAYATTDFALGTVNTYAAALTYGVPHQNDYIQAIPYITIYEVNGTVTNDANFQIYPYAAGSITNKTRYIVKNDYDYHLWKDNDYTGTRIRGQIIDTGGTSGTAIAIYIQWVYFEYLAGTVT